MNNSVIKQFYALLKNGFDAVASAIKPAEKLKVSIEGISVVSLKGDKPSDKELLSLINPLIPKLRQPSDGHTPTDKELLSLIRPLIPQVKDGHTPTDNELLSLIRPLIPKPIQPEKVDTQRIAREAAKLVPVPVLPTIEETASSLDGIKRQWLSIEAIRGDFNAKVTKQFGGGNTTPLNVRINNVDLGGFRELNMVGNAVSYEVIGGVLMINFADSGGGAGFTKETPGGDIDGVNATYTVTAEPNYVVADGTTYFDGAGYSYSALSIVLSSPPTQFIRSFY